MDDDGSRQRGRARDAEGGLPVTTKIDLTSPGFLEQYAIIFAASSLLTVAL